MTCVCARACVTAEEAARFVKTCCDLLAHRQSSSKPQPDSSRSDGWMSRLATWAAEANYARTFGPQTGRTLSRVQATCDPSKLKRRRPYHNRRTTPPRPLLFTKSAVQKGSALWPAVSTAAVRPVKKARPARHRSIDRPTHQRPPGGAERRHRPGVRRAAASGRQATRHDDAGARATRGAL